MNRAVLNRTAETEAEVLTNNEAAVLNAKTLSLDYDKLENTEIRQHRRRITENSWINFYGVMNMRLSIERTMTSLINIFFSLILFAEMVSLLASTGFDLAGIMLFAALIIVVILNFVARSKKSSKVQVVYKTVSDQMLEENRLSSGYSPDGMDNVSDLGGEGINTMRSELISEPPNAEGIAHLLEKYGFPTIMDSASVCIGGQVCDASRHNSYVIGVDGSVKKCTAALYDEANNVGYIDSEGILHINEKNHRLWHEFKSCKEEKNCELYPICYSRACPYVGVISSLYTD